MGEVRKREYRNGELVSDSTSTWEWTPNAADLDLVAIKCKCGNEIAMPFDAACMPQDNMFCGECGVSNSFSQDPLRKIVCEVVTPASTKGDKN